MKNYKLFAVLVAGLLVCYFLFNLLVWKHDVELLLNDPLSPGGDLTRLGYVGGSKMPRRQVNDLPRRHLEPAQYRGGPVDVVTLGDSFSNGGGYGRNSFYQDYLASRNGFTVLNLPAFSNIDKLSTLSLLLNNGTLDRIRPKFVLLECSEKKCLEDLPQQFDFERSIPEAELAQYETVKYQPAPAPASQAPIRLEFLSDANFKFVRNLVLYRFSDHAFLSKVYQSRLDRPFFSVPKADTLLFYDADVKSRAKTPENIARYNDALNTLQDRLAKKGMTLYFMPCVDKYNLYSGYLVRNRYPRSIFFEELRRLPRRYQLIDTKAILSAELARGEKDVFYADDTHWSWKASEAIFKAVRFPRP